MTREEAMEVYKDRSAKFKNTQGLQWKMNLSIWTLLALAIRFKNQMHFSDCVDNWFTWQCGSEILIGAFLIFIHVWYCYKIQRSLESDKAVNDEITIQLNQTIDQMNVQVNLRQRPVRYRPWHWIIIQGGITLVLAVIFLLSQTC